MPRKRRKPRTRVNVGRERMSDNMEAFLAGDDAALTDENLCAGGLLSDLVAQKFFAQLGCSTRPPVNFSPAERARLDKLEQHYEAVTLKYDHAQYRERAIRSGVLTRYEILLKRPGSYPQGAWTEAIGPGPNSIVYNVPNDEPKGKSE
jgi:hypothetical protein